MYKTSVPEELVQIWGKLLWYEFKEVGKSARLDNKFDKDESNKDEAKNHMIADLVTLALEKSKKDWEANLILKLFKKSE